MKYLLTFLVLLSAVGCGMFRIRTPAQDTNTVTALTASAGEAAAGVGAAREMLKLDDHPTIFKEVADRELEAAEDKLPKPTAEQALAALERAYKALKADNQELARIYAEEKGNSRKLADALSQAQKKDVEEQAKRDRMAAAKAGLAKMLMTVAVGFVIAGLVVMYAFKHKRIAILCGVGAGICGMGAWMMVSVPDKHIVTLFWVLGISFLLALLSIPFILYWGYKVGLWQKPPTKEKKGEYIMEAVAQEG